MGGGAGGGILAYPICTTETISWDSVGASFSFETWRQVRRSITRRKSRGEDFRMDHDNAVRLAIEDNVRLSVALSQRMCFRRREM